MSKRIFLLLLICMSAVVSAEEVSIYDDLLSIKWLTQDFEVTETEYGIDFDSEDKVEVSDGLVLSRIHTNLEGPFPIPDGTTIDQAINWNIDYIVSTADLNKDYPTENRVAEGVGAVKVDVNGFEVGYIDYQVPSMNMAKIKRAVLVSDKGMYSFTRIFFDPDVEEKRGMFFDALIIALGRAKLRARFKGVNV